MNKISKSLPVIVFLILLIIITLSSFFVFFEKKSSSFVHESESQESESKESTSGSPKTINKFDSAVSSAKINKFDSAASAAKIKAVYLTAWSAASPKMFDYVIEIAKDTEINGLVIDIKDWSGKVSYDTQVPEAEKYNAERKLIPDLKSFLEKLHGKGIYTIARIVVFQDPVLASARPDLAVRRKSDNSLIWLDKSGLAWIDPASIEAWNYNIALAEDALSQGFDEVNFDYVRFPSDGDTQDASFPFWVGNIPKSLIIKDFLRHVRKKMPEATLSIDLFGLVTVSTGDLGVGQLIEDAYESFDYICPMVYPSHYAPGFHGYENPAEHASEVVKFSLETALERLKDYNASHQKNAKLRPWLQDFNMGAVYDKERVRSEINATIEALGEDFAGFMMWNSKNIYTTDAFLPPN